MIGITDKITEFALKYSEASRATLPRHFDACITLGCRKYGRELDRYDRNKAVDMLKLVASLREFDTSYNATKYIASPRKANSATAIGLQLHSSV